MYYGKRRDERYKSGASEREREREEGDATTRGVCTYTNWVLWEEDGLLGIFNGLG